MNNKLIALCLGTTVACTAPTKDTPDDTYVSSLDTSEADTAILAEPLPTPDFSQRGSYEVFEEESTASVTNCPNMSYTIYSPVDVLQPPVVVLAHGFARGAKSMTGWAEHLASWGVEVLLPTLCHYNVLSGVGHEMNGRNMNELATTHGALNVIYAGHSAGGLAAIIAASHDSKALGVLGLDATDTEDIPNVPDYIGREYASNVTIPALSLLAESSVCNSANNGLDLFQMMEDYHAIKVTSADHCDFESPTDWVCESSCENTTAEFTDEEIRPVITTLGTSAILSLAGLSTTVWTEDLEVWTNTGIIQILE